MMKIFKVIFGVPIALLLFVIMEFVGGLISLAIIGFDALIYLIGRLV